jgi:hypothetical protein
MAPADDATKKAFGAFLQTALFANATTADAVKTHLARRGIDTTITEIERWQAGATLPDPPAAISALEEILLLVPGALVSLTRSASADADDATVSDSGPAPGSATATDLTPMDRLRLSFHPDVLIWSRNLHAEYEIIYGPDRYVAETRVRLTEEALMDGVDRYLDVTYGEAGKNLLKLRSIPVSGCRRGRLRIDPEAGNICSELLLEGRYLAGETFAIEFTSIIDAPSTDTEFFAHSRGPIIFSSIRIKFDQQNLPARAYESVPQRGSPPVVRPLRISGGQVISTTTRADRGIHRVSWEWE